MELTTQLAVFLDNKPGALARVCEVLGEADINIIAISTNDTVDHVVIRMVVSDPRRAAELFKARGAMALESEVLLIAGDNRPGSLARLARRLADEGINIDYAYCATSPTARQGVLILHPTQPRKALKVLNS
ncbi:MAG: ACT domain-containing protein [Verrucomicrobiota bacterium]